MVIYVNNKEYQALHNAWEEVNAKLECCMDDEVIEDLREILKRLSTMIEKCKKQ